MREAQQVAEQYGRELLQGNDEATAKLLRDQNQILQQALDQLHGEIQVLREKEERRREQQREAEKRYQKRHPEKRRNYQRDYMREYMREYRARKKREAEAASEEDSTDAESVS